VLGLGQMRRIRRQLARIAAGWLVLRLCTLVFVPTALCSTPASGVVVAAECTCEHGDGQVCPMHHTRSKPKSTVDQHSCSCRSASDPVTALAASLIGPAAVMAPSASAAARADAADWLTAFNPVPLESAFVPEAPPPRA